MHLLLGRVDKPTHKCSSYILTRERILVPGIIIVSRSRRGVPFPRVPRFRSGKETNTTIAFFTLAAGVERMRRARFLTNRKNVTAPERESTAPRVACGCAEKTTRTVPTRPNDFSAGLFHGQLISDNLLKCLRNIEEDAPYQKVGPLLGTCILRVGNYKA